MNSIIKKNKVMFVDDEINILNSIKRGLLKEPYEQIYVLSAKEALKILEEEDNISVIVTDLRMPEMNGLDLLKIVHKKYPQIIRMVLTGYTQVSTILAAVNNGHIYRYLVKPWKMAEEFIPAIRQSIIFYNVLLRKKELESKIGEIDFLINKNEELTYQNQNIRKELSQVIFPEIENLIHISERLSQVDNRLIHKIGQELYNRGSIISKSIQKISSNIE